jgi:hypothetical protein
LAIISEIWQVTTAVSVWSSITTAVAVTITRVTSIATEAGVVGIIVRVVVGMIVRIVAGARIRGSAVAVPRIRRRISNVV